LAIVLELILDVAFERERLGMIEIDAGVIEILAVVDADGNEAAGLGMRFVTGPLEDRDSAQVWRIRVGFGDLAGILRGGWESESKRSESEQHGCFYPQSSYTLR
jgi:hypothetical protein